MHRTVVTGWPAAGRVMRAAALLLVLLIGAGPPLLGASQPEGTVAAALDNSAAEHQLDVSSQLAQLRETAVRLPLAAALAGVLAMRPRRRGTPPRQAPVIQTQIILAVVGAVVMLVVGSSLARAFGIVGAAGLVRYRAKVNDPKDAGVMLSTLAIGLASGVGLWMIALFATAFILAVLWVVESFEPKARQVFLLTVTAKDAAALKPKLDALLQRSRLEFELRTVTAEELCYEVRLPLDRKTDRLSAAILQLDPENANGVGWEARTDKK